MPRVHDRVDRGPIQGVHMECGFSSNSGGSFLFSMHINGLELLIVNKSCNSAQLQILQLNLVVKRLHV